MEFRTELCGGTVVTFAGGSLSETVRVGFAALQQGRCLMITDRTPFHPLSLTWPDQPGDRGWMTTAAGVRAAVLDSHEGLLSEARGLLFTGDDALNQRRNDPDLRSVVVHVVDSDAAPQIGDVVMLAVDPAYRAALSLQHTGVHLAALALNQGAAQFWTKEHADVDSLGIPNFDKAAVTGSGITETASTDVYRIGKSLRKKGFDRDSFVADLAARTQTINDTLCRMLLSAAPVVVTPGAGALDDRRQWSTVLDGAAVSMPCGGTHVSNLSQIAGITVALAPSDDGFTMVTTAEPR